MLPSRQRTKPPVGATLAGQSPRRGPHACLIVATGTPSPDARRKDTDPAWSKQAAEQALEEVAALLEGDQDQELVIRGVGEDGDICLDLVELAAHASLRDHRSWLRTSYPPPKMQRKVVLNLEIEGEPEQVREAASELLRELGEWVEVNLVTMTWY